MNIKTAELTDAALDWAVEQCLPPMAKATTDNPVDRKYSYTFRPSTDWAQGGPILERERICVEWRGSEWRAYRALPRRTTGIGFYSSTPLIAAMRCFVASRLGDEADVPDELI